MADTAKVIQLISSVGDADLWESDDAGAGKVQTTNMGAAFKADMEEIMSRFVEFSMDTGTASGGSNTTLVDAAKSWETDVWKGAVVEVHCAADSLAHYATITGNTATTLTFGALAGAVSVASGDDYAIRLQVGIADIYKWGGTAQTGRDVSGSGMGFNGATYENQDTAIAVVTAVVVTAGGSGYTSAPTVAFSGGGGTGATATATVSDADAARRFETSATKLRGAVIQVTTKSQSFGDASNQRLAIAPGGSMALGELDISTLYFKNAIAGQNGTVTILGVNDA